MKLGCRWCGARLDSEAFRAHLDALVGETARHVAAHATYDRAAIQTPSALPARAWRASEPVDGTPGVRVSGPGAGGVMAGRRRTRRKGGGRGAGSP